jgi:hypothetical protein
MALWVNQRQHGGAPFSEVFAAFTLNRVHFFSVVTSIVTTAAFVVSPL